VHYKQEQYVSFFIQTGKSHFSADFQCALCNPNDGTYTNI